MRTQLATAVFVLCALVAPADAEDEDRTAALARADKLSARVFGLWKAGRYAEAEPLAEEALRLRERILGAEHPKVAASLINLGAQLRGLRRYDDALHLYQRALSIREKTIDSDPEQVVVALSELAMGYVDTNQHEPALASLRRAIQIREEALGEHHRLVAPALTNLASLLDDLGRYDEARPLYERALRITEKAYGPEHVEVAAGLSNLAISLQNLGAFARAKSLHLRALRMREKLLGSDHPDVAGDLHNLGLLLYAQGSYKEAKPLLARALALQEKAHGPQHADVATTADGLASVLDSLGAYEEAGRLYVRALEIRRHVHGPDHPDVAFSHNNVGANLQQRGAYEAAQSHFRQALAIMEKRLGPDHPEVATSLNNLALTVQDLGDLEGARGLLVRALEIEEKRLGPAHPNLVTGLGNLAQVLTALGAYDEARQLLERALAIGTKALGRDHPLVAGTLNNLAHLREAQGAYEEAKLLYRRFVEVSEKAVGEDHPNVATGLGNLARVLETQGRYAEARPLYARSIQIAEAALGPEHPEVGKDLNNLALLLCAQKAYEEAIPHLQRAMRIFEKALGSDHRLVAGCLSNLGCIYLASQAYSEAQPLFERALAMHETLLGHEHPGLIQSLNNMALVLGALGQYARAGRFFERCLAIVERSLRVSFNGLHAPQRLAMLRSLRGYLDRWLELAPHVGRTGYGEVLRFKGLVARAMAAERRLARRGGNQVRERGAQLRAAERRLARLANAAPSAFPREGRAERKKAWQEAYAKAGAEREALALSLTRDFAASREGAQRLDLATADIQAQLAEGEVMVDTLRSRGRYLAWILRREGAVERVELGDAKALEEAAAVFSELAADGGTEVESEDWRRAAGRLRALTWARFEKQLGGGTRTVYLSPDAALAAIPFAALPSMTPGRFLIDDYQLVSLSMAQDLVPWQGTDEAGKGVLLVGGVDYERASDAPGRPPAPLPPTRLDRVPRGGRFAALGGTGDEVRLIAARFRTGATVLENAGATEAALRSAARGKRVLHLATHGFVRGDLMRGMSRPEGAAWLGSGMERQLAQGHDPMVLAGLAMAGANARRGGHGDDGVLSALEASHLELDGVDLVVLSACETALGKSESGEGVIGLVRGFQMAGARRVVGSLWRVDDRATRFLMERFYEGMLRAQGPLSPAAALRRAALSIRGLEVGQGRPFAHPRYWAAFVTYGR